MPVRQQRQPKRKRRCTYRTLNDVSCPTVTDPPFLNTHADEREDEAAAAALEADLLESDK